MKSFNGTEVDISDTTYVYVEAMKFLMNRITLIWAITLLFWWLK